MRVCLVSQEYPPGPPVGGIGTQTLAKARGLVGLGHHVDVVTSGGADIQIISSELVDGITIHAVPPRDRTSYSTNPRRTGSGTRGRSCVPCGRSPPRGHST